MGKEYAERTRELVVAGDKVLLAARRWKAESTPENTVALLAAKVEYLEAEIALSVFLRERLEARVQALEAQAARGGASKRGAVRTGKKAGT